MLSRVSHRSGGSHRTVIPAGEMLYPTGSPFRVASLIRIPGPWKKIVSTRSLRGVKKCDATPNHAFLGEEGDLHTHLLHVHGVFRRMVLRLVVEPGGGVGLLLGYQARSECSECECQKHKTRRERVVRHDCVLDPSLWRIENNIPHPGLKRKVGLADGAGVLYFWGYPHANEKDHDTHISTTI